MQTFDELLFVFCKFAYGTFFLLIVKRTLSFLLNKYIITALVFIVLMLFFDQNDWFTQRARQRDLNKANEHIAFMKSEITDMKTQLQKLQTDPATLERYAREKYYEKRDNEDVYMIVRDTAGHAVKQ